MKIELDITNEKYEELVNALKSVHLIDENARYNDIVKGIVQAVEDNSYRKNKMGYTHSISCRMKNDLENGETGYEYRKGDYVTVYTDNFKEFRISAEETCDLMEIYDIDIGDYVSLNKDYAIAGRTQEAAKAKLEEVKENDVTSKWTSYTSFLKNVTKGKIPTKEIEHGD